MLTISTYLPIFSIKADAIVYRTTNLLVGNNNLKTTYYLEYQDMDPTLSTRWSLV